MGEVMPLHSGGVLVTGGAGGIGAAAVRMLRARGLRVSVADRVAPEIADHFFSCDFSIEGTEAAALDAAKEALGCIGALVICAGRYESLTLESCSLDSLRLSMRVNVESPFVLINTWLADAATPPSGVIVIVGSAAAQVGSRDPAYSTSKAGLAGMARSLSLNLASRGYSVFTVSPGIVDTQMSQAQSRERRAAHIDKTMLKRAALPEEIAEGIGWLVAEAPHYLSGSDLNMSNGIAW